MDFVTFAKTCGVTPLLPYQRELLKYIERFHMLKVKAKEMGIPDHMFEGMVKAAFGGTVAVPSLDELERYIKNWTKEDLNGQA